MSDKGFQQGLFPAVSEHISLVQARILRWQTGDQSALRLWHKVHGTVVFEPRAGLMTDAEWASWLGNRVSRYPTDQRVGAAIVTQALACMYAVLVGKPVRQVLDDLAQRLSQDLGDSE